MEFSSELTWRASGLDSVHDVGNFTEEIKRGTVKGGQLKIEFLLLILLPILPRRAVADFFFLLVLWQTCWLTCEAHLAMRVEVKDRSVDG